MITEPAISEVLDQIKSADVVLHGVGDALTMAHRRRTPEGFCYKANRRWGSRRSIWLLF
ncbi:hypothetical protein RWD45_10255 [Virgibacillus soli]|uniref:Uncharacterized protein n=1 Tax=Paracerasibacillus soli TaxID=480284 RepID=A0ABU5CR56_9BACI|nr:hypothetical protein [Virgibacillus soli]MDY0408861.1 hypothetical protein [Virgibacillus soli]